MGKKLKIGLKTLKNEIYADSGSGESEWEI
jgi:hypothetical protein